jgi:hypothetical protein
MSVIENILDPVELPEFFEARQIFDSTCLRPEDIREKIGRIIAADRISKTLRPGDRVAITAGSRGISHIDLILAETVRQITKHGARPYIVACMGSHGGNAAGQRKVLEDLGITEERVGAPVIASDDLVIAGHSADGRPVYVDKFTFESDALVVVNRVKPHTAFRAPVESGLQKMLAVGLGKQKGADACHVKGFEGMYENVTSFASVILEKLPVAFGIGVLENAYGRVYDCVALPGKEIAAKEPELLEKARALMPKILFEDFDVLIVDEMGKDISGSGMDTNVIGRYPTPEITGGPRISKIAVLDLTAASEGNAHGAGFADFISRKLFDKIRMDATYPNCLTNKVVPPAKIPPVMPSDLYAVKAALKTCGVPDPSAVRAVWIKNTHDLEKVLISSALVTEAIRNSEIEILSPCRPIAFSRTGVVDGNLW